MNPDPDGVGLDLEMDEEWVVRLIGVESGALVVIEAKLLEQMLTEVYSAWLCDRKRGDGGY